MTHRFTLQPYNGIKSRFKCPKCQHHTKTFKRYIDTQTNQYLADHVGKCDRDDKCGYHYSPREYFKEMPFKAPVRTPHLRPKPEAKTFNTIPLKYMKQTMGYQHNNNFLFFLGEIFTWIDVVELAEKYHIGTARHWHGATVFWQADIKGRIRTGKIMLYDKSTGKRVKEPFNHIAWVHALLRNESERPKVGKSESKEASTPTTGSFLRTFGLSDYKLQQCFFGEHLLALEPHKPVAITESEKTAVMASIMMPDFIWLAAGSLHGLDEHKCRVLKNRTVLLFPDVGAYYHWAERARILNQKIPTATFSVHDEMERTATFHERSTGADMADRWVEEWFEEIRD